MSLLTENQIMVKKSKTVAMHKLEGIYNSPFLKNLFMKKSIYKMKDMLEYYLEQEFLWSIYKITIWVRGLYVVICILLWLSLPF